MAFGRGPSGVYEKPKRSCPTVVLPPIGPPASASAQAAEPVYKSKRRRKPKSLEDLGRYTATSGCYELIDELMQSVLLERPAAVLPPAESSPDYLDNALHDERAVLTEAQDRA